MIQEYLLEFCIISARRTFNGGKYCERKNLELSQLYCNPFGEADSIECGKFAEAMITMLRLYTHYQTNDKVDSFVRVCSGYMGRNAHEIPAEEAKALYKEYNDLKSVLHR